MAVGRAVAAALIVAVAFAVATWLHSSYKGDVYRREVVTAMSGAGGRYSSPNLTPRPLLVVARRRAGWQDPLAVLVLVLGVGAGIAVLLVRQRSAA